MYLSLVVPSRQSCMAKLRHECALKPMRIQSQEISKTNRMLQNVSSSYDKGRTIHTRAVRANLFGKSWQLRDGIVVVA